MSNVKVYSPINGELIGEFPYDDPANTVQNAESAFDVWKNVPAPKRGELIRLYGSVLREYKDDLAVLITRESGKIFEEALGEVQEMIDICDFAVGLSRQLYGLTMPSERPQHRLLETWHPLGPVLVISAFNFPAAVWAWNFTLAIVCGNSVIWKPSLQTPFTALKCQELFELAILRYGQPVPKQLSQVVCCHDSVTQMLLADTRIKLVSATGSTRMGKQVAPLVAERLGRSLLELGGNNAMIVSASHMHSFGALILAELIQKEFPYIVFEIQENSWVTYDNTGKPTENILKNS